MRPPPATPVTAQLAARHQLLGDEGGRPGGWRASVRRRGPCGAADVDTLVRDAFPGGARDGLATAVWALVHGLAFPHLDGKFDASSPETVAEQVGTAVRAVVGSGRPR